MKKIITLISFITLLSCTNENIDSISENKEKVNDSLSRHKDEAKDSLFVKKNDSIIAPLVTPILSWKKLTYSSFKKDTSTDEKRNDSIAFKEDAFQMNTIENLGIQDLDGRYYNFTRNKIMVLDKTRSQKQRESDNKYIYTYSRDSLNYTITITIDTILSGFKIPEKNLVSNDFGKTNKYELLMNDNRIYTYQKKTIFKKKNFLTSKKGDEFVFYYNTTDNFTGNFINNGVNKTIITLGGTFNAREFSLIGRDLDTNERIGKGESIHYYYEDFLIQEFESFVSTPRYLNKKELTAIEYLK